MELQQNKQQSRALSSQLVTIMTTEHYNLQTGRAMMVSEANGRASLFVGAVSSGLVALALVAQLSHLGAAFAGGIGFLVSVVLLQTYQQRQWVRLEKSIPVNFPRQGSLPRGCILSGLS